MTAYGISFAPLPDDFLDLMDTPSGKAALFGRHTLTSTLRLVDEILNSVLFLLIGLEVLVFGFDPAFAGLSLASIPPALLARFLAVALPVMVLRMRQKFAPGTIPVLTWGGLRGGISIALALSLPDVAEKPALLAATYAVVVFTIVIQGLSLRSVVERVT